VTEILNFESGSLQDTQQIGQKIAQNIDFPSCIYLQATMGQGKTTVCKSIIAALGCTQVVTSPTYNLIQEYLVDQGIVYHMDLYRLEDPSELEFLAVSDLWSQNSVFLIEWPQNGGRFLPPASHQITIDSINNSKLRKFTFSAV